MSHGLLGQIARSFAGLSLIAIGGANAIVPELHRVVVQQLGWMNDAAFADAFALAQAAPGPNVLVASLIGWQVAGLPGLLVATAAIIGPSCVLAWVIGRLIMRLQGAVWLALVQAGLVPVAVGLILASGVVMARTADHGTIALAITAGSAAFVVFTSRNPLWALTAGVAASLLAGAL